MSLHQIDPSDQATVILRTVGERTAALSHALLHAQTKPDQLHRIEVVPFQRAVRRTFQIGIDAGRRWTIAVDGDVLVRPQAINDLVDAAEKAHRNDLFQMEGRIFDKLFHGPRAGGLHLYRTSMLDRALEIANRQDDVHRPESHVVKQMKEIGLGHQFLDLVLGIHDFEQSYRDLYRKGFVHAQKHADLLELLKPMWQRLSQTDPDFQAVLLGMEAGLQVGGIAWTDITAFDESVERTLLRNGLPEKPPLSDESRHDDVATALANLQATPEFLAWQQQLKKRAARLRLRRRISRVVTTIPKPVRLAIRHMLRLPSVSGSKP